MPLLAALAPEAAAQTLPQAQAFLYLAGEGRSPYCEAILYGGENEGSSPLAVNIRISGTGGYLKAGEGGDKTVTIPPGSKYSNNHYIGLNDDSVDGADGSLTCEVRPGTGYRVHRQYGSSTGKVRDNDPTIVSLARAGTGAVDEGGGKVEFTVTLSRPLAAGETIGVPLAIGGAGVTSAEWTLAKKAGATLNKGVALSNADTATPKLTFTGHATDAVQVATLELTSVADDVVEIGGETIEVALGPDDGTKNGFDHRDIGTNVGGGANPHKTAKTFDIEVNEPPGVILSRRALSLTEDGAAGTYTATLTSDPGNGVRVTVTATSADAGAVTVRGPAGAAGASATLIFTGGSSGDWNRPQTVTVAAVIDDNLDDESVRITHAASAPSGNAYRGIGIGALAVTVSDVALPPTSAANPVPNLRFKRIAANSITAVWAPVPGSEGYVLRWREKGQRNQPDDKADKPSYTIVGLKPNTAYQVRPFYVKSGGAVTNYRRNPWRDVTTPELTSAAVVMSPARLSLAELGGNAAAGEYTVNLNTDPEVNATVTVTVPQALRDVVSVQAPGGTAGGTAQLTFTPGAAGDWNEPQKVTVRALNDADAEDESVALTHAIRAASGDYASFDIADKVTVAVKDAGHGVIVEESQLDLPAHAQTVKYGVRLKSAPGGKLVITPALSGSLHAATVSGPLTFTNADWNDRQEITVTRGGAFLDLVNVSHAVTTATRDYPVTTSIGAVRVRIFADDRPRAELSVSGDTVWEGRRLTVTATLNEALFPGKEVTLPLAWTDGTATAGADYTRAASITIAAGETSGTATVPVATDQLDEGDETFTVAFGALPNDVAEGAITSREITIADGVAVALATPDAAATEGDAAAAASITLALNRALGTGERLAVPLAIAGGALGTDYSLAFSGTPRGVTLSGETVTFNGGSTPSAATATLLLSALDDDDATDDRLTVSIPANSWGDAPKLAATGIAGGATGSRPGSGVITVTDDDTPALLLDTAKLRLTEGGAAGTFTLKLATEPSANVTVTVSGDAQTALTVDADDAGNGEQSSVAFTAVNWNTARTVTVTAGDDEEIGDYRATLTLEAAGGNYAGQRAQVVVTVEDTDLRPTAAGKPIGRIRLTGRSATSVSVAWPPVTGADGYRLWYRDSPGTFRGRTISTETNAFTLTDLDPNTGYVLQARYLVGGRRSGWSPRFNVRTLFATPGVAFSKSGLSLKELGRAAAAKAYSVVLNTDPGAAATVTVTVPAEHRDAVTVQGPSGPSGASATLRFTAGNAGNWDEAQTVTVRALNDADIADETLTLAHAVSAGSGAYASLTGLDGVRVLVTDAGAGVAVAPKTLKAQANGGTATYGIRLHSAPGGSVTITPASANTARAAVSGALTFTNANWSNAQEVVVTGGASPGQARITHGVTAETTAYPRSIRIDDVTVSVVGKPTVSLAVSGEGAVAEGANLMLTLALDVPVAPAKAITIPLAYTDDTATAGTDYTKVDSITIPPGGTSATATLATAGDSDDEPDETFTVALGSALPAEVQAGASASADVTIADDDATRVTLTTPDAAATEGDEDETASITLTLGRALAKGESLAVPLAIAGGTVGTDYGLELSGTPAGVTFSGETVTFAGKVDGTASDTTATVLLTALDDDDAVNDTLTVSIPAGTTGNGAKLAATGLGGGAQGLRTGDGAITVTDDDTPGLVVSTARLTATEGGASRAFTVKLATEPSANVTVTVTGHGGTNLEVDTDADTSGDQDTLDFTANNWNTEQTVTVTAGKDSDTADDTVTLALTAAGGNYGAKSASVVVTIPDVGVTLSKTALGITELGGNASAGTYTVTLDTDPGAETTVTVTVPAAFRDVVSVQAPGGTVGPTAALTFTAGAEGNWSKAQTLRVRALNDADIADESVVLTHAANAASGAYRGLGLPDTLTVSVSDAGAGLVVDKTALTINVPAPQTYTVRLKSQPTHAVTVTPSSNDETRATVSPPLEFTTANWKQPQTVTVNGQGRGFPRISHAAASSDPNYDGIAAPSVDVTVNDLRPKVEFHRLGSGQGPVSESYAATGCALSQNGDSVLTVDFRITEVGSFLAAGQGGDKTLAVQPGASLTHSFALDDDRVDEPDGLVICEYRPGAAYQVVGNASKRDVWHVRDNDPTVVSLARVGAGAVDEGGSVEFTVTLSRSLTVVKDGDEAEIKEVIAVPLAISGTGVTTGDWSLALKTGESLNKGVALSNETTATPRLTFTGHKTDVVQVATLTLTAKVDETVEAGGETFEIALGPDGKGANGFDAGTLTTNVGGGADPHEDDDGFTVKVNELPVATFAAAASDADEDAGTVNVAVNLSLAPSANLALSWTVGGTATAGAGEDFTISGSGSVTVTAGATSVNIPVAITDDSDDELAETVVLTLTGGSGYAVGAANAHTLTIADNDATTVTLTVPDTAATEGDEDATASMTLTLGRALAKGESLAVPLAIAGGTVGTDYGLKLSGRPPGVTLSSETVTFAGNGDGTASAAAATVLLTALDDDDAANDTLVVSIPAGATGNDPKLVPAGLAGGASGSRDGDGVITVTDDETLPGITLPKTELTLTELGGASAAGTYSVRLNTDPGAAATVTVTVPSTKRDKVTVQGPGGTAGHTATLSFTHGGGGDWSTPQTVTVRALNDEDVANESVVLAHAASATGGSYASLSLDDEVTVTVRDAGHGVIVAPTAVSVRGSGGTATWTIRLKSQPGGNVTVTPTSGAPVKASVSAALSFSNTNWKDPQEVTVTGGKGTGEVTVTHAVTATTASAAYPTSTAIDSVKVTVTADPRPAVTLGTDSPAAEGANLTVTATLDKAITPAVAVAIPLGYANDTAAADDYTSAASITIDAGARSGTATLAIADDTADEPPETFTVSLGGSLPAAVQAGATESAVVTITDGDPTLVSLARSGGGAVTEGGKAGFTVSLSRALAADEVIDVPLAISGDGVGTADWSLAKKPGNRINKGVALSGEDTATPKLTFRGHSTDVVQVATLELTAAADEVHEAGGETIRVALGPDGSGANGFDVATLGTNVGGGADPHGTSNKFDLRVNEAAGVILSKTAISLTEGGAAGSYTATLTTDPGDGVDVTLTVTSADGDAVTVQGPGGAAGASAELTFSGGSTGNWNRPQTVTVAAVVDADVDDRTVRLSHAANAASGDYRALTLGKVVTVTVSDNVLPPTAKADPVSNLKVKKTTANIISVAWSPVPDAEGYVLRWRETGGSTKATAQLKAPRAILTGLVPGTGYQVRPFYVPQGGAVTNYRKNPWRDVTTAAATAAEVALSKTALRLTELGGNAATDAYTVRLNTDPGQGVGVTVRVTSDDAGAATVDTDTARSGNQDTLLFTGGSRGNWKAAQTVTVTAINDAGATGETVTVSHRASAPSGNDYDGIAIGDVTVTVTDAGHGVAVQPTRVSVSAGGGTAKYAIRLKSRPGGNVTITPTSGTPAKASVSGAVSFNNGNWATAQEVMVAGGTGTGNVRVTHAVTTATADYPAATTIDDVAVTVTADVRPAVTLTSDSPAAEGANLTVTATLDKAVSPSREIAIPLTYTDDTATAGTDYTRADSITIAAGQTRGTATVAIADDNDDETNETFTVALGELPPEVQAGATTSADVSITDGDPTLVSLAREGSGALVEGGKVEFTVSLTRALAANEVIDVPLAISGEGVTTGDWSLARKAGETLNKGVALSNANSATPKLTFEGHATDTVRVATLELTATADDTEESGGETFKVALGPDGAVANGFDVVTLGTNVGGGADPHGTNNKFDLEVNEVAGVILSKVELSLTELGGASATGTYTLKLATDPGVAAAVTVTVPATLRGVVTVKGPTGVAGDTARLNFTPGGNGNWSRAQKVTVAALNDADAADETGSLTHAVSAANGDYASLSIDDEVEVEVTDAGHGVIVNPLRLTVDTGGGKAKYTVRLKSRPGGNLTIAPGIANNETRVTLSGALNFNDGNWQVPQEITVTGGAGTGEVIVSNVVISNTAAYPFGLAIDDVTATVVVARPVVTLSVSGGGTVAEGADLTVTATLDKAVAPNKEISIPLTYANGSAEAADYTSASSIAIASGQKSGTATVAIAADSDDEPSETFTVSLGTLPEEVRAGTPASAEVTIIDDDTTTVTMEVITAAATEGDSEEPASIMLALNREMEKGESLAIPLAITGGKAGTDYTLALDGTPEGVSLSGGTVTFAGKNDGTVSAADATVLLTALDDDDAADDTLAVSIPAGATGNGARLTATGLDGGVSGSREGDGVITVADDDEAALDLSASTLTVAEGGAAGTFMVRLATQPTGNVTVTVTGQAGTDLTVDADDATKGSQTSVVFTTENWSTARTVNVAAAEDGDAEDDTATLTLTASGADYGSVTGEVDVTVTDDEGLPGITVSPAALALTELGGAAARKTFTVVLNTDPGGNNATVRITVPASLQGAVTVQGPTGVAGTTADLVFTSTNYSTAQTVTVRALNDANVVNERGNLTHGVTQPTSGDYTSLSLADRVAVTVTDAGHGVAVAPQTLSVRANGGTGTYKVRLKSQPGGDVEITPTSDDTDKATVGGALTFTSSNWKTDRTVTVTGAAAGELDIDHAVTDSGDATNYPTSLIIDDVDVTVTADARPAVTLSVSGGGTVAEGADLTVTATLDKAVAPNKEISIPLTYANGSAEAADYTSASSIAIASGQKSGTATVAIADDSADEPAETFTVSLGALPPEVQAGAAATAAVTITDGDPTTVTLTVPDAAATEGDGDATASITLTLNRALAKGESLGVPLSISGGTLDTDYELELSGTPDGVTLSGEKVTFAGRNDGTASATAATVLLSALDDEDATDDTLAVSIPAGTTGDGAKLAATGLDGGASGSGSGTVTVTDDDEAALDLSDSTLTVAEGGAAGSFTVRLASKPSSSVTVTVTGQASTDLTVDADDAVQGEQASVIFTTTNWSTARTVSVTAAHDTDANNDAATLTLTATGGDYGSVTGEVAVTVTDDEGLPGVRLSEASLSLAELGGASATGAYTVRLSTDPAVSASVTVTVPRALRDAVTVQGPGGTVGHTATLTFTGGGNGDWATPQTVTVRALNDGDDENESVTLVHAADAVSGDYDELSLDDEVTVTVTDAGHGVIVAPASVSVRESGGKAKYAIRLKSRPGGSVTVTPTSGAPAKAAVSGAVSFSNTTWQTPQEVTVTGGTGTGAVTVTHAVTAATADYPANTSVASVAVTVTADARPAVTLTTDSPAAEGANLTVTATLDKAVTPGKEITIPLIYTDDTARTGTDYTQASSITIASGQTSGTATVAITDDTDDELSETFTVSLGTLPPEVQAGAAPSVDVTITDGDPTTVTLSVPDVAATEGDEDETASVKLTLGRAMEKGESLGVPLAIAGGTLDTDYELELSGAPAGVTLSGETVTFAGKNDGTVSATSATVLVSALDDDDAADDTLTVSIPAGTTGNGPKLVPSGLDGGASGSREGDGEITVTDDDEAPSTLPGAALKISQVAGMTMREGGPGTFAVWLANKPTANVTVTVTVSSQTGATPLVVDADTAKLGKQSSVVFTPENWNSARTVTIVAGHDDDANNDKATLKLTATGGGYASVTGEVTLTVVDDEGPSGLTVSKTALALTELGGASASGTYTIRLNADPGVKALVVLHFSEWVRDKVTVQGPGGVADYFANLTFTPGDDGNWSTPQTVTVRALNDADVNNERYSLWHTTDAASGDYRGQPRSNRVWVNVTDAGHGVIVEPASVSVPEGGGTAAYAIRLKSAPGGSVTITPTSGDGTRATVSEALSFDNSNWATPQEVTVTGGTAGAGEVTVRHAVTAATSDYPAGTAIDPVTVTVTVTDDRPAVALSVSGDTVAEGADLTVTATLDKAVAPNRNITIPLTYADDTATAGTDYTKAGSITIAAGRTKGTATVAIADDDSDEPRETFTVSLGALPPEVRAGETTSAAVTIIDADPTTVTLSVPDAAATEGDEDATASIALTLGRALQKGESLGVPLSISGGTLDTDYELELSGTPAGVTLSGETVTFAGRKDGTVSATVATVLLTALDDDDAADDTLTVSIPATDSGNGPKLAPSGLGGGASGTGSGAITVTDDDEAPVDGAALDISSSTLTLDEEGAAGAFTVKLAAEPTAAVTVTVTGQAGTDLTVDADDAAQGEQGSVVFTPANWSGVRTVTVSAGPDSDANNDTATLTLTAAGGGYAAVTGEVAVTVRDDESLPRVTLSVDSTTLAEGADLTVTATLDKAVAPDKEIAIPLAYTNGTTRDDDYTKVGSITIAAGETSGTATVAIADDDNDEPAESFWVVLEKSAVPPELRIERTFREGVTITDDDPSLVALFGPEGGARTEGDEVELTVKLTRMLWTGEIIDVPLEISGVGVTLDDWSLALKSGSPLSDNKGVTLSGAATATPRVTFTGSTAGLVQTAVLSLTLTADAEEESGGEQFTVALGPDGDGSNGFDAPGLDTNVGGGADPYPGWNRSWFRVDDGADRGGEPQDEAPPEETLPPTTTGDRVGRPILTAATGDSLSVIWPPVTGAEAYEVRWWERAKRRKKSRVATVTNAWTVTDLKPETEYVVRVSFVLDGKVRNKKKSRRLRAKTLRTGDRATYHPKEYYDTTASRWWAALDTDARVRALWGKVSEDRLGDRRTAAAPAYKDLDAPVKAAADAAAAALAGGGKPATVAAWWDGLDCRLRRIAVGAGNAADAASAWCSDHALLGTTEKAGAARIAAALFGLGNPAAGKAATDSSPKLAASDAAAVEGAGAVLAFLVRLDEASGDTVTVDYATRDVTATAGADYTAASGTLTFAAGETKKTVTVAVLDDGHDEGRETLELVLSNAKGAALSRAVATGTIVNTDPMPKAWLARFGRTVAEQVLDGVADRIGTGRGPGFQGTFAGQALPGVTLDGDAGSGAGGASRSAGERGAALAMTEVAERFDAGSRSGPGSGGRFGAYDPFGDRHGAAESQSMTVREALLGSSFSLTSAEDDTGGTFAFWGRAAESRFDGKDDDVTLDGEVTTGLLGMDYARDRWLIGLALGSSAGEGSYRLESGLISGAGAAGEVESNLTAAVPWAALRASRHLTLWGAAGYGSGDLTLTPSGSAAMKADLDWSMAAAGARAALIEPWDGGPALDLVSDALQTRTASEKAAGLVSASARTTRLRMGLEGTWRVSLDGGGSVAPEVAAGVRHDGGDAETGFGVELGGGIAWSDPVLGLDLDVEGRTLLAHEADGLKDRGFSAGLAFDPDPATQRGPSLTLRQDWGGQADGGLDALFQPDPLEGRAGSEERSRWSLESAWGFPVFSGRFTGSPHVGLGLATGTRDYTVGWRLSPETGGAADLSFDLKAERSESDTARPQHAVGVELTVRW